MVRAGFKKTQVNDIPRDWEMRRLGELITLQHGFAFSSAHFSTHGPILLTPGNFRLDGGLQFDERNTKHYSGPFSPSLVFEHGDLLIVMTDLTPDCNLLGKPAFMDLDEPVLHNQRIGRVIVNDSRISSSFLYWHFLSSAHAARMKSTATGSTVRHTSNAAIYDSLIALPFTRTEQEVIATALSDADDFIESLEQLIAKKRRVKEGAMQELLTGKRRLPGYSEKWEERRLGEIGSFLKGSGITKNQALSGSLPCVRYGEIYTKHSDVIRAFYSYISPNVAATATRLQQGDILFAGSGETKAEIGKAVAFVDDGEVYAGGDIIILRPQEVDSHYLGYYLNTPAINKQKASRGQGDAVVHIRAEALSGVRCSIPSVSEQAAIAAVLSDMDSEIAAIAARVAKARRVRQGMMQELLTGRTRLI